jgi:tungstate transport system substrate-binding protein
LLLSAPSWLRRRSHRLAVSGPQPAHAAEVLTRARALLLAALAYAGAAAPAAAQSKSIVLATTTSTRDAGLLDVLLPVFERQTGYTVKVVAVGSGEALELGRRGEADLVLAHAPQAERVLADSGYFIHRRLVMHNQFLIVGPPSDPDSLRDMADATAAFRRIWERQGPFASRGDESGTHKREKILWQAAGHTPPLHQSWYLQTGQGMGATLHIASERQAYTLTDIATYLTQRASLELAVMVQGDPALYNVYHVLELNPKNGPRINLEGGKALADFFVAPATQQLIGEFGISRFGRPLFVPDAGKPDRW